MKSARQSLPLRLALLVLLPASAVAAVQAAVFPHGPQVPGLAAEQLRQPLARLRLRPLAATSEPPWRSGQIALSPLHRWRLPQGLDLQVQQVAVQQRPDFQLATATRAWTAGRTGLALGAHRRIEPQPSGALVSGRLARQGTVVMLRQTCLRGAGSGVTAAQLGALADQGSDRWALAAARVLGLQPNRSWHCLMVSLSHRPADVQASAAAATLWPRLLKALAPLAS